MFAEVPTVPSLGDYAMRYFTLLALSAALVAGTAFADDPAKPAAAPAPTKAPHGAKVFFDGLKSGATVGQDLTVKFGAKGIAIKPSAENAPNSCHHHLLIDVADLPPGNAPIPNDATHKHYGKGQTEDTIHLAPGDHTLQLDCADAAHMQFNPPLVSKKITVHVK